MRLSYFKKTAQDMGRSAGLLSLLLNSAQELTMDGCNTVLGQQVAEMDSHAAQLLDGMWENTKALANTHRKAWSAERLQGADIVIVIPGICAIHGINLHIQSPWAKAYRVTAKHFDGTDGVYFMKVSEGHHGHEALRGEFEATRQMSTIAPDFCPSPIARGTFNSDSNLHFYICNFHELYTGVPEPDSFCEKLARLHSATSPQGKFGFHVTTYNGNLPQDNTWFSSWEECFSNGMKHVFKIYRERAGPQPVLEAMLPDFYSKVIPRLLRPLETGGRKLQPSFVHGDLWCGNAAIIDEDTKDGIVFDPASFWAHNECVYVPEMCFYCILGPFNNSRGRRAG